MPGRLVVSDLTKAFGRTEVLRGLSLTVEPGTTTAIVGPSGSGKSTLLRAIAGFERSDSGTVELGDRMLSGPGVWVPAHHRTIGYVAQDGALFPHLTVGDNVAFGMGEGREAGGRGGRGRKARGARVAELLDLVSLDPGLTSRRPHEISGGQQQRVALARALARRPSLMLLDESFSSLDAGLRVATRRTVSRVLGEAGITTVLVTHDQAEALSFADQVAVIRDGVLAQVGPPREVYRRPVDRATGEFLGDAVVLDAEIVGGVAHCLLGEVLVDGDVSGGVGGAMLRPILLRPEQIRVDPASAVRGVVEEIEYFGAESTVRLRLGSQHCITIRHWDSSVAQVGDELGLTVEGAAVVLPGGGG